MKKTLFLTLSLLAGATVVPAQAGILDTFKKYSQPATKLVMAGAIALPAFLVARAAQADAATILKSIDELDSIALNTRVPEEALVALSLRLLSMERIRTLALLEAITLTVAGGVAAWGIIETISNIYDIHTENKE